MIKFTNTYDKLPSDFFESTLPEKSSNPKLICFNHYLAKTLGINLSKLSESELAQYFSGNKIFLNSNPIATAYAGFQFGHPVPSLGDGRAHLLGEVNGHDIQLKGSGRTKFSRRGDGKSALGPVLREYIVSEAMHALGVPTTRALCAVTTGDHVFRQEGPEPGGIFTRVAASHLRVGSFQYFAFKNDIESIKTLLDYTISRHYQNLEGVKSYREKSLELLKALTIKQADLIAKWSSYGFIHGVMNTDNFSMAGITIDFGPCAFMDEFKFDQVFSSIDHQGRYAFFNQVPIAKWNILRLAETLIPLVDSDQQEAIKNIEKEIMPLFETFEEKRFEAFAKKLGIVDYQQTDSTLVINFLTYLEKNSLDMTNSFRNLPKLFSGESDLYPPSEDLNKFTIEWKKRVSSTDDLNNINPIYIPRNHLIQKVIEDAYENNFNSFHKLLEVVTSPFREENDLREYARGPKPHERVYQTFCGT